MNSRIKLIRKELGITQAEFGNRIGVRQNTITSYETGIRTPSEAVILSICREFSVNEVWLREGVGPMFIERTRRDDLFDFARRILGGELSDIQAAVVSVLAETTPEEWELFEKKIQAIYTAWKTEEEADR